MTAITNTSGQAETGRFLSVAKVKDELGCSREHVYDLIEAGALVAIRLGTRKFSVSRESLEAYIAQHTYKPAPQPEAQQ